MNKVSDEILINKHPELFFKYKNNKPYPYFKEDIINEVNLFIPKTFLWIMKDLDIPYFESEWLNLIVNALDKNKDIKYIIGIYISKMKLKGLKSYTFKDSCYNKNIQNYLEPIKEKINVMKIWEILEDEN